MPITKKTPINTKNSFDSWWIKSAHVSSRGISVEFLPYNGEHALAVTPKRMIIPIPDKAPKLKSEMGKLQNEIKRQWKLKNPNDSRELTAERFILNGISTNAPVNAICLLKHGNQMVPFAIPNIYNKAKTDSVLAKVLDDLTDELGKEAKNKKIID
jgi:hypothetical protein